MKKKTALQSKRVGVLQMAFLARKVFGTFEKRAPGLKNSHPERDSNPDPSDSDAVRDQLSYQANWELQ